MINKTYQIRGIYDGIQEKSVFAVRYRDDRSDGGSGIRCYHVPVHSHSDADRHHHDQARKCVRAAVRPAARTGSRRSCSRYRLDDLRPDDAGVRTGGVDYLPAFLPDGMAVRRDRLRRCCCRKEICAQPRSVPCRCGVLVAAVYAQGHY